MAFGLQKQIVNPVLLPLVQHQPETALALPVETFEHPVKHSRSLSSEDQAVKIWYRFFRFRLVIIKDAQAPPPCVAVAFDSNFEPGIASDENIKLALNVFL